MRSENATPKLFHRRLSFLLIGVFITVGAVVANSGISSWHLQVTSGANGLSANLPAAQLGASSLRRPWLTVAPLAPLPPAPVTVDTDASDCATPKTLFNVRDTDKTVCAKVANAQAGWRVIWSNSRFVAVQTNILTAANQSVSFTLGTNSSLGDWRVIVFEPFGGTVQAVTTFTVVDAQNPVADVAVSKGAVNNPVNAGAQALFGITVTNNGPDVAENVHLADNIPADMTSVSFVQLTGPVFTCNTDTSLTDCSIATLNKGDTATFLATYQVDSVQAGTEISNIAVVSTTTAESNTDNNASTSTVTVQATPCMVTCPSNITVQADAGQSGAIVNYTAPTSTGSCGQINCNIDSGSFFPAGTTTVICAGETGDACTFQVTVENPGGLSISLNGASTLSLECGQRFTDPGATAVNASGQSVPVTVTNPQGFDPTSPATGSYVVTYTATEDPNSVSTTRTVNVGDTEKPAITVDGANPYRIIQGSCLPFVDPGASASDACAGPEPITRTIAGPGGATAVDNNVPGTYTVTYTATDGTHTATATRTVFVGQFSEDEADQPATSNVPPTITLNGDDEVTLECGNAFTDPGATASVCGHSVSVTTSGTVDVHTPGSYSITYSATANGFTSTATRIVTVNPDNTAPTIQVLGANPMTVECHTSFTDPGATAHDACAGDFAATASGTVNPNVVGTYVITYNATDPSGFAAAPATRTVNVVDTTNPVVTAPANLTVYTGSSSSSCAVVVSDAALGAASATDSCSGSLSVTRTGVPAGNSFPVGTTTVTYSATDPSNNTGTATQTVTVIDNTVPVITTNGQTLSMWPPNHNYQTFQVTNFVTGASDNCTSLGVGDVVIEKVTSDEIENGNGDGNTTNDIVIAANCKSVQLRSEREGNGDGRVYTITFKVTDTSGNVGRATAKVVVNHNPGETAVDSGVQYTVNGTCP